MASQPVTSVPLDWLESHWASVTAQTSDPRAGIFGPTSISWKINRESALFLGAGRAALLQLAHPWVAAALDRHSGLRSDPLARFHNTFRVVFTMIFGTLDQALACSRHLYRLHAGIQGRLPRSIGPYSRGSHYQANEVNALLWVFATLIESALLAYQAVFPTLTPEEREAYYAESKTMAALFGIPLQALPPDWAAFETYMTAMANSDDLGVNQLSAELACGVLYGKGSWIPVPAWYRSLTAAWMPPRLRSEFALAFSPDGAVPGEADAKAARTLRWLQLAYPKLPGAFRFVGPYREACARLQGRFAGSLVRASNRFWMGQPHTMFVELEP